MATLNSFNVFGTDWVLTSLGNSGLSFRMEQGHCGDEMATYTLICDLADRPRRCPTLSNPVLWQSWMAAYAGYTLQMKTLFPGRPIVVHDMHMRIRNTDQTNTSHGI